MPSKVTYRIDIYILLSMANSCRRRISENIVCPHVLNQRIQQDILLFEPMASPALYPSRWDSLSVQGRLSSVVSVFHTVCLHMLLTANLYFKIIVRWMSSHMSSTSTLSDRQLFKILQPYCTKVIVRERRKNDVHGGHQRSTSCQFPRSLTIRFYYLSRNVESLDDKSNRERFHTKRSGPTIKFATCRVTSALSNTMLKAINFIRQMSRLMNLHVRGQHSGLRITSQTTVVKIKWRLIRYTVDAA